MDLSNLKKEKLDIKIFCLDFTNENWYVNILFFVFWICIIMCIIYLFRLMNLMIKWKKLNSLQRFSNMSSFIFRLVFLGIFMAIFFIKGKISKKTCLPTFADEKILKEEEEEERVYKIHENKDNNINGILTMFIFIFIIVCVIRLI